VARATQAVRARFANRLRTTGGRAASPAGGVKLTKVTVAIAGFFLAVKVVKVTVACQTSPSSKVRKVRSSRSVCGLGRRTQSTVVRLPEAPVDLAQRIGPRRLAIATESWAGEILAQGADQATVTRGRVV
jgi:hypothetical protein